MLLAQFILMIVDRALYLRKDIFGKFILQIILVAVVHIWMFFILPLITQRSVGVIRHMTHITKFIHVVSFIR